MIKLIFDKPTLDLFDRLQEANVSIKDYTYIIYILLKVFSKYKEVHIHAIEDDYIQFKFKANMIQIKFDTTGKYKIINSSNGMAIVKNIDKTLSPDDKAFKILSDLNDVLKQRIFKAGKSGLANKTQASQSPISSNNGANLRGVS